MRWEDTVHTRWAGRPLDPEAPVCAELLMAALADRPELGPRIGPYLAMLVGPAAMEPVRDEVRAMLRAGWRPAAPSGVTRDELAAVVRQATAAVA